MASTVAHKDQPITTTDSGVNETRVRVGSELSTKGIAKIVAATNKGQQKRNVVVVATGKQSAIATGESWVFE